MRKIPAVLSLLALIAVACPASAEQTAPLGRGNVALKLGYGVFMDDFFEINELDHSTFVELEGYCRIAPNVYLGANLGAMFIGEGEIALFSTTDVDFFPLELNVKYAREIGSRFVVDGGAGVSYSYASIAIDNFFTPDFDESDWLPGGQVFADLIYKANWLSLGIYGKYQMTGDFRDENVNFNNWRGGLTLGVIF